MKRVTREHKTIEKLHSALIAGRMVTWEWNIVPDEVHWSHQLESVLGLTPGTFDGIYQAHVAKVHPEDREVLEGAILHSRIKGTGFNVEHRVMGPGGAIRWVRCRGKVSCDRAGRPVRMAGVCADITERKRVEEISSYLTFYGPPTELPNGASLCVTLTSFLSGI